MARNRLLHSWCIIHKWTSLICTAFLLVVCLTDLPRVFSEEINHWLSPPTRYATVPPEGDAQIEQINAPCGHSVRNDLY